jgi:ribosomal protein S17E
MGRIKTVPIKRATYKLIELHGSEFTDDYVKNKQIIKKFISTPSKKLINIICGYATRMVKRSKAPKRLRSMPESSSSRFS